MMCGRLQENCGVAVDDFKRFRLDEYIFFFFSSRRRHTRFDCDWSSDVCSSDLELGGEPKTEMWYIAEAAPDSELFVGLKRGTTRRDFENKLRDGSVAECFHREIGRASCRERV